METTIIHNYINILEIELSIQEPNNIISDILNFNQIKSNIFKLQVLKTNFKNNLSLLENHGTYDKVLAKNKEKFLELFKCEKALIQIGEKHYLSYAEKQLEKIHDTEKEQRLNSFIQDIKNNSGNWITLRRMKGRLLFILSDLRNSLPKEWF